MNNITVKKLTKAFADSLQASDIVYAEFAEGGAMGCPGQLMLCLIQEQQIVCYLASIFEDEETCVQVVELLLKHSGFKTFPFLGKAERTDDNPLYDYYFDGLGNHVFMNAKYPFKLAGKGFDGHFICIIDDRKYEIYTSVYGIFNKIKYRVWEFQQSKKGLNFKIIFRR
jgi:hypothetical protein